MFLIFLQYNRAAGKNMWKIPMKIFFPLLQISLYIFLVFFLFFLLFRHAVTMDMRKKENKKIYSSKKFPIVTIECNNFFFPCGKFQLLSINRRKKIHAREKQNFIKHFFLFLQPQCSYNTMGRSTITNGCNSIISWKFILIIIRTLERWDIIQYTHTTQLIRITEWYLLLS